MLLLLEGDEGRLWLSWSGESGLAGLLRGVSVRGLGGRQQLRFGSRWGCALGQSLKRWQSCSFSSGTVGMRCLGMGERKRPGTRDSSTLTQSNWVLSSGHGASSERYCQILYWTLFLMSLRILVWEDRFDGFCSHWVFFSSSFNCSF